MKRTTILPLVLLIAILGSCKTSKDVATNPQAGTPTETNPALSRGIFQKRCRSEASHVPGTGHLFREYALTTA
jgi:hypothetical protein